MAKLKVTETARRVTLECEFEVERAARHAIGATIYGGTNEIQREIIAKAYGL